MDAELKEELAQVAYNAYYTANSGLPKPWSTVNEMTRTKWRVVAEKLIEHRQGKKAERPPTAYGGRALEA